MKKGRVLANLFLAGYLLAMSSTCDTWESIQERETRHDRLWRNNSAQCEIDCTHDLERSFTSDELKKLGTVIPMGDSFQGYAPDTDLWRMNSDGVVTYADDFDDERIICAGGTMSYAKETNMGEWQFGSVGHGLSCNECSELINDKNTQVEMIPVDVDGIDVDDDGFFTSQRTFYDWDEGIRSLGSADASTNKGVFGTLHQSPNSENLMQVGTPRRGAAQLLTSIDESGIKAFDVELRQSFTDCQNKNFVIVEIVDDDWPSVMGNILGNTAAHGMSGAPIIQNGKLVAIVSYAGIDHVGAIWAADMVSEHKDIISNETERGR